MGVLVVLVLLVLLVLLLLLVVWLLRVASLRLGALAWRLAK